MLSAWQGGWLESLGDPWGEEGSQAAKGHARPMAAEAEGGQQAEKATITQHHPCTEKQRSAVSSAPLSAAGETTGQLHELHAEHTLSELVGGAVLGGGGDSRRSS